MAKKDAIRHCVVCGEEYEYCPHCSKDRNKEPWHFNFHNENCFKMYYIVSDFVGGEITEEVAQEKLLEADLSYMHRFNGKIAETVNQLLTDKKKPEVAKVEPEVKPEVKRDVKKKFTATKADEKVVTD